MTGPLASARRATQATTIAIAPNSESATTVMWQAYAPGRADATGRVRAPGGRPASGPIWLSGRPEAARGQ